MQIFLFISITQGIMKILSLDFTLLFSSPYKSHRQLENLQDCQFVYPIQFIIFGTPCGHDDTQGFI